MQKVYAIVKKEKGEIVMFGLQAKEVYQEWENYYVGTPEEETHLLQQTFMSQEDIRKEMSIN